MKNFVDLKIDEKRFVSQFGKIHRANQDAVKVLKTNLRKLNTFQPNSKSFEFTEWTSEIELGRDEFYPDFEPQDQVEFGFARDEENFRTFIVDTIPQIQKYF